MPHVFWFFVTKSRKKLIISLIVKMILPELFPKKKKKKAFISENVKYSQKGKSSAKNINHIS